MFPYYRVPLIIRQAARFNFGFASNMIFMLWCVCGGFLLHMLESNYLTILLRPSYEKAVDGPQDIIDRDLKILWYPPNAAILEKLKNSPSDQVRTLADLTIVAKVIFLLEFKINKR